MGTHVRPWVARNVKHGLTAGGVFTPEYVSWYAMKARCYNKKHTRYKYYGGRGITVCLRWRKSFIDFLNDMGKRPKKHSIDRIDVNGNYEPGNCRWATQSEQRRNQRPKQTV